MALVLALYAVASVLLLVGAGVLVVSAFRSATSGSAKTLEEAPSLQNLEANLPPGSPQTRDQLIERLERQFHNSPSYRPDV